MSPAFAIWCLVALAVLVGLIRGWRELSISAHRWDRPRVDRDLFNYEIICGFVTVRLDKETIRDRLRALLDAMENRQGGS